jgi:hypothetical protein
MAVDEPREDPFPASIDHVHLKAGRREGLDGIPDASDPVSDNQDVLPAKRFWSENLSILYELQQDETSWAFPNAVQKQTVGQLISNEETQVIA